MYRFVRCSHLVPLGKSPLQCFPFHYVQECHSSAYLSTEKYHKMYFFLGRFIFLDMLFGSMHRIFENEAHWPGRWALN
jgi:hypothetical protein